MLEEALQQEELRAREREPALPAPRPVGVAVQPQVVVGQDPASRRPAPVAQAAAHDRLHAREQLAQGERLDQVVVGSRLEPGHPVVDGVARGQHEDGHLVARGAHAPADLHAVHVGHRHVEDHRVHAAVREGHHGLEPVVHRHDVVALELQGVLQRGPDRGLVVDHEDRGGGRAHPPDRITTAVKSRIRAPAEGFPKKRPAAPGLLRRSQLGSRA
ncbi:MAG: hypothetical protein AVDCRST_MAG13-2235 [uncultured Solirubrobacteraceae bacterium]|uniref:Uncharacterized protein n=1 Tax=uncultured Solirubrobacteraceae bacterium TaxID=1162706 RepID=A0A6J4SPR4_9ACTN|nr:MAG: hypothetical protein AVDCRST_MAG13-2235 [uncultured Solirubrobacteraceae bacterium]